MNEILEKIAIKLYDLWIYDLEVLAQPWLYWWLGVPAIFYMSFMIIKWALITIPIWLPIKLIVGDIKLINIRSTVKKK